MWVVRAIVIFHVPFFATQGASLLWNSVWSRRLILLGGVFFYSFVWPTSVGHWGNFWLLIVVWRDAVRVNWLALLVATERLFVWQGVSLFAKSLVGRVAAYEHAESASCVVLIRQELSHNFVDKDRFEFDVELFHLFLVTLEAFGAIRFEHFYARDTFRHVHCILAGRKARTRSEQVAIGLS